MDKEKTTVTMSLKDYEELNSYKEDFKNMIHEIRRFTYIDKMTSDEITVGIIKQEAQNFLVPYAAENCELDCYPDGVKVNWK